MVKTSFFNEMVDKYLDDNSINLHTKSVLYLTSEEEVTRNDKLVLNISQLGLLNSLDPNLFPKGRFDTELLDFLTNFRDRVSIVLIKRLGEYFLVRIVITDSTREDRISIDTFMGGNLDKYPKFSRQTTEDNGVTDNDERIIDINHIKSNKLILHQLKDLTIIFGY